METLLKWDGWIYKKAQQVDYKWLDQFFLLVTDRRFWGVLGIFFFILFLVRKRFGRARVLGLCLLALWVTDYVAAQGLKPYFQRYRPCFNPVLHTYWRQLVECGGPFGMPSNHAANAAAVVTVVALSFGAHPITWVAMILGLLVGFSRIYLGVHYPSDVLAGFLVGIAVPLSLFGIYRLVKKSSLTTK